MEKGTKDQNSFGSTGRIKWRPEFLHAANVPIEHSTVGTEIMRFINPSKAGLAMEIMAGI